MVDAFLVVGLGALVYMATQAIKTVVDVAMGKKVDGTPRRKDNVWLTRIVFPSIPVVVGILLAVFVPFRPTVLIDFVTEYITGFSETVAYAAYGAIVGQFSKSLYMEGKAFFKDFRLKRS